MQACAVVAGLWLLRELPACVAAQASRRGCGSHSAFIPCFGTVEFGQGLVQVPVPVRKNLRPPLRRGLVNLARLPSCPLRPDSLANAWLLFQSTPR